MVAMSAQRSSPMAALPAGVDVASSTHRPLIAILRSALPPPRHDFTARHAILANGEDRD
ncbi:MAG: hypothetical protein V4724_41600 [Pseudomonadota bacterium]